MFVALGGRRVLVDAIRQRRRRATERATTAHYVAPDGDGANERTSETATTTATSRRRAI